MNTSEVRRKYYQKLKINKIKKIMEKIKCYLCCYGGHILAVGAGCMFGVNLLVGTLLLLGSGFWAYKQKTSCCKNGTCKTWI